MYMEEELIELVRATPVLYDLKHKGYRNQNLRKEAWDEIGEHLDRSGEYCKETWNKLRNAYTNALNRRKLRFRQESSRKMGKWTFEDQMAFLPLGVNSKSFRVNERNSIEISQDDTQERSDDNSNDVDVEPAVILTNEENDSKPAPASSQVINEAEAHSTDQFDVHVVPNDFENSKFQEFVTRQREPKLQNRRLENTMTDLVTVMKKHNQMLSKYFAVNNCISHDEEETYFISLAKFVKRLKPTERIRVKAELAQIIFQAEMRCLPEEEQQPFASTSQHISSEQLCTETIVLCPKIEKE